jgi:UDP-glucose 4-epimerase
MPPRALVTGAGGFIGANLARRLRRDGHPVDAVVRPGTDTWRLDPLRGEITLHALDLRDGAGLAAVLDRARPDWIFHLAAHGAYAWQTDAQAILTTNAVASARLLDLACARGFEAFVQAGSAAEHGVAPAARGGRFDAYAASKTTATRHARTVAVERDAHVVTLRLGTAYGPWEEPRRLMPALAMFGLRGRLPPLADPASARDFVFVDDVCEAFVRAARATDVVRGTVVDVASGTRTSLAQVVALAREELAIGEEPRWSTRAARPRDAMALLADAPRMPFGWRPRKSLREGFRSLVGWLAQEAGPRARYAHALDLDTIYL